MSILSTTLLLCLLAQTPVWSSGSYTIDDFWFDRAQEDFVIDSTIAAQRESHPEKPVLYGSFMPPEVAKAVDLWDEECPRCKDRGVEDVAKMGPEVLRWMFWARRSVHSQVQANASKAIHRVLECRTCGGKGYCFGDFREVDGSDWCGICGGGLYSHQYIIDGVCKDCDGWGMCGRLKPKDYRWSNSYQAFGH